MNPSAKSPSLFRRRFAALSLVLILLIEPAFGKEPEWKKGRLVDVSIDSYTKTAGVNGTIVSKRRKVWTYVVEDNDREYFAEINKALQLEVNTSVEFAVEKDRLFLRDSAGKTQKLEIIKTVRK